jgi:hypothetical protein
MNTDNLARCTFVLDRSTAHHLAYLSRRFQRSRSDIVRELLKAPVETMAELVQRVPDQPTPEDLRQLVISGLEMVDGLADEARGALREVPL